MASRNHRSSRSAQSRDDRQGSSAKNESAYFVSLTVENTRCFGQRNTINLSDSSGHPFQWIIILGDNGTGKTTLLQSMSAFRPIEIIVDMDGSSSFHPSFPPIVSRLGGGFFRRTNSTEATIVAEFNYGGRFEPFVTGDQNRKLTYTEFNYDDEGPIWRASGNLNMHGSLLCAYGAGRRMGPAHLSTSRTDHFDGISSIFFDHVELQNAEEWLLQADYKALKSAQKRKEASDRLDSIRDILVDLLPDVESLRFTEPDITDEPPSVEFQTPFGWIPLRTLGLGYRTMIAWMVDFASRLFEHYPDSPRPTSEPAVCVVDEIDLHLHPRWQRTIMRKLNSHFPNTQFIVTAHSPLFVQSAAGNANITVLRREGGDIVIDQSIKGVEGWRVDQLLTSDLFGLDTARSLDFEELIDERQRILLKKRPNAIEKRRLADIQTELAKAPLGETQSDREAWELVREAAEAYRKERQKT